MANDSPSLPVVDVLEIPASDATADKESAKFSEGGKRLDRNLRRLAGYGALGVAAVLYGFGLALAVEYARPAPLGLQLPSWHVVAATLAALFTVPTVLVLAVLRSASVVTKDADADSLHAAIGTRIMALLDKLVDGLVKH